MEYISPVWIKIGLGVIFLQHLWMVRQLTKNTPGYLNILPPSWNIIESSRLKYSQSKYQLITTNSNSKALLWVNDSIPWDDQRRPRLIEWCRSAYGSIAQNLQVDWLRFIRQQLIGLYNVLFTLKGVNLFILYSTYLHGSIIILYSARWSVLTTTINKNSNIR